MQVNNQGVQSISLVLLLHILSEINIWRCLLCYFVNYRLFLSSKCRYSLALFHLSVEMIHCLFIKVRHHRSKFIILLVIRIWKFTMKPVVCIFQNLKISFILFIVMNVVHISDLAFSYHLGHNPYFVICKLSVLTYHFANERHISWHLPWILLVGLHYVGFKLFICQELIAPIIPSIVYFIIGEKIVHFALILYILMLIIPPHQNMILFFLKSFQSLC